MSDPKGGKFNLVRSALAILALLGSIYYSVIIIKASAARQLIVAENAEVQSVKYGLLSVHAWKRQVSDIIAKKVREFQLTEENRAELKVQIQNAMYQLLDEVEEILDAKKEKGNWLQQAFTAVFEAMVFDVNDLRDRVPEFTEIVLDEIDNYETREKLRLYIQEKVDEFMAETVGEEDLSQIEALGKKYDCQGIPGCSEVLTARLQETDSRLMWQSLMVFGAGVFIFMILLLGNKQVDFLQVVLLVLTCTTLLIGGISTPMIDIDARIDRFEFLLMGEPLSFQDQVLFFQSKSILEVVRILVSTSEFQSILVGALIFIFSIVFPFSKLISSVAVMKKKSLLDNHLIRFLALKSGKWSMADVMVVAIFMSFIGFQGVIGSQLSQLETINEKIEVFTTDNSDFGVGFILFLAFCLGGLFLAAKVERLTGKPSDAIKA